MAVGQAPAASILAPAASILAPARILQYFQYTGKRYQYTVLAPLEQPVQHTSSHPSICVQTPQIDSVAIRLVGNVQNWYQRNSFDMYCMSTRLNIDCLTSHIRIPNQMYIKSQFDLN